MSAWFFDQLRPQAPGLWILLSFLSLLIWLLLGNLVSRRAKRYAMAVRWLLVPYLGLISGGLSPRLMGLSALDWLTSLSFGIGIIFTVLVILLFVRATTAFSAPSDNSTGKRFDHRLPLAHLSRYINEWVISGVEEFHWSFLRGGLWEMLLTLPNLAASPAYLAVWLAALGAGAELLILSQANSRRLLKLVVLLTTTILFFYTRNFWLGWFLHGAAWLILQPVRMTPTIAPVEARN